MADYTAVVYHATKEFPGNRLLSDGYHGMKIDRYSTAQILSGKVRKNPGNLGYGFYSFVGDPFLAQAFGDKFSGRTVVLKLRVTSPEENILSFATNHQDRLKFRQWLLHPKTQSALAILKKYYGNQYRNTSVQKSLDGIMTELFCLFLKDSSLRTIQLVEQLTHTAIDGLPNSSIPNGVELLIKSADVVTAVERYDAARQSGNIRD
ncbi:hypothetical protein [Schleiferilactobacillus shenzhenensis]|uniref:hypothetical protein n=1 Tax=Schleiferilactobacillus shenzhenensis TaxID=1231337 RepID=UPI00058F292E|nr:hypothetical protein [Schleiferilactobacillus shenzhenensis]